MAKQKSRTGLTQQYILAGGGLGLYFGLFFRPVREPNFAVAVALALLATAVIVVLALLKKDRPPLAEMGRTAVTTFIKFALVLALLEGRHYAHDLGGKWLVTLFATLLGAGAGWWLAQVEIRKTRPDQ
jgi:hypothetical protein